MAKRSRGEAFAWARRQQQMRGQGTARAERARPTRRNPARSVNTRGPAEFERARSLDGYPQRGPVGRRFK